MKSMKQLLRLIGSLTFTTVVVTPVVACGPNAVNNTRAVDLDMQICKDLGFYDDNNNNSKSKLKVEINCTVPNKIIDWKVTSTNTLTAVDLLDSSNRAKSQESFNFIIKTLNIKPEFPNEKEFTKATFFRDDLSKITILINTIKPKLTKMENNKKGLAIIGGTFKVQFISNNTKLGSLYRVNIEPDANKDIIGPALDFVGNQINNNIESIEAEINTKVNFKVGEQGPTVQEIKDGIEIQIVNTNVITNLGNSKDGAIAYLALDKLLRKTNNRLMAVVGENTIIADANRKWAANDILEIKIILVGTTSFVTSTYTLS